MTSTAADAASDYACSEQMLWDLLQNTMNDLPDKSIQYVKQQADMNLHAARAFWRLKSGSDMCQA